MKIVKNVRYMQEGGQVAAAPAPEAAPAQQGAGMEEQIAQMAQEIVGQLGPEGAAMLAQMIMEMIQGGQAPAEQPVFKKGGCIKKAKKCACGGKAKKC